MEQTNNNFFFWRLQLQKEANDYWQEIILFIVFRQEYDFILEEVLEMIKKQIEQSWCHDEFFKMMSEEDKDVILRDHFGIIRPGFWKPLYEYYFYEENQGDILSILENNYEFLNYEIEKPWKSLDEYSTNHEEFNEQNKDLIFQEHHIIIRS